MTGKPISQSREEIIAAVERTRILMDLSDKALEPQTILHSENVKKQVIKEAVRIEIF